MADNYLEKRYDEVFGSATRKVKHVGHSLDELLIKNRSCRGYVKDYVVTREVLEQIVDVCTKVPSARNQQVLRYKLVTRDTGAAQVLANIKLGGALPELHLPFPDTEPESYIIVCSSVPENKMVDIDLGIALQSMLLKAVELGLNGIIVCAFNKTAITDIFHLPCEPLAILAIGKGKETFRLVPISENENHAYYRDKGVHVVPKVKKSELLLP